MVWQSRSRSPSITASVVVFAYSGSHGAVRGLDRVWWTKPAGTSSEFVVSIGSVSVVILLVALCAASYVLQLVVPGWTSRWAFSPVAGAFEPWRFLTAAFLHSPGQVFHILFNMIALWMVGPYLEQTLGRARYATLYLLSAIGGSVAAVVGPTARYGIFQEVGTVHHAAQPFAQPALNKNAGPYEQALGKAVEDLL